MDDAALQSALALLQSTRSGLALLERTKKAWAAPSNAALLAQIRPSDVSRTDAVLTRRLDPKTGHEQREREVTVYVRLNQPLEDLVLDLAHELVHATARPAWDPYDPSLTVGRYIQASIEGEGGEVEAVSAECEVSVELAATTGARRASAQRCRGYLDTAGAYIDRAKIKRDFYRMGKWHAEFVKSIGAELKLFPLLTPGAPELYSSTGQAPYPVALLKEYQALTNVACANTLKRVQTFASRSNRTPATTRFLAERCR